jgi:tetratricopeptide (TPR) repeat protein
MINLHLNIDIRSLNEEEAKKKIDDINRVAEHFCDIKYYDESNYCAEKSLQMAEAINYKRGIANAKRIMGIIFSNKEDYSSAITKLVDAELSARDTKDFRCIGKICQMLGVCYWNIGDYSSEIEAFFKAASAYNNAKMRKEEANSLNSIGNYYLETQEFSLAIEYYKKSISISKELRDVNGIIFTLYNMALTFNNKAAGMDANNIDNEHGEIAQGLYKKALKHYLAAQDFNTKLERNEFLEHRILQNIGHTYTNLNRNEEALELFSKNIDYFTKTGNEIDKCDTLIYISLAYLALGKTDESEESLSRAKEISERLNIKRLIMHVCRDFSSHYERRKMFKEALYYNRKYTEYEFKRTKTLVEDRIRKLNILHTVDITKKETQILSEKNQQLQELNKKLIKLNSDKNYFLNLAANDLRTPLEKISRKINTFSNSNEEEKLFNLKEILKESSQMQDLISNLLTLNESQSAK